MVATCISLKLPAAICSCSWHQGQRHYGSWVAEKSSMNNSEDTRFKRGWTTAVGIGAMLAGFLVVPVTPGQEKAMDEAVGSLAKAHLRVARPTDHLTEVVQF